MLGFGHRPVSAVTESHSAERRINRGDYSIFPLMRGYATPGRRQGDFLMQIKASASRAGRRGLDATLT